MDIQSDIFLSSLRRHYSDNVQAFIITIRSIISVLETTEKLCGIAEPNHIEWMYELTSKIQHLVANERFALDADDAKILDVPLGYSDISDYMEDQKVLAENIDILTDLTIDGIEKEFPLKWLMPSLLKEISSLDENKEMKTFSQLHLVATAVRNMTFLVNMYVLPYIYSMGKWWPDIYHVTDLGSFEMNSETATINIIKDSCYLADNGDNVARENLIYHLITWLYGCAGNRHVKLSDNLWVTVQDFGFLCSILRVMTDTVAMDRCAVPNPYLMYPGLTKIRYVIQESYFYWQISCQSTKTDLLNNTGDSKINPWEAYNHPLTRVFDLMMCIITYDRKKITVQTSAVCFVNPVIDFTRFNSKSVYIPIWQRCGHQERKIKGKECYCVKQARSLNIKERVLYHPKIILLASVRSDKTGRNTEKILLSIIKRERLAYIMKNFESYRWFKKYFNQELKVPLCGYPQPSISIKDYKRMLRDNICIKDPIKKKYTVTILSRSKRISGNKVVPISKKSWVSLFRN